MDAVSPAPAMLDADAARSIAENGSGAPWNVALERYEPVESSQEERPGGRVDHTFVYERTTCRPGRAASACAWSSAATG